MSKTEEYKTSYQEVDRVYDQTPRDLADSLRFLVEDMLETMQELELKVLQLEKELKQSKEL